MGQLYAKGEAGARSTSDNGYYLNSGTRLTCPPKKRACPPRRAVEGRLRETAYAGDRLRRPFSAGSLGRRLRLHRSDRLLRRYCGHRHCRCSGRRRRPRPHCCGPERCSAVRRNSERTAGSWERTAGSWVRSSWERSAGSSARNRGARSAGSSAQTARNPMTPGRARSGRSAGLARCRGTRPSPARTRREPTGAR